MKRRRRITPADEYNEYRMERKKQTGALLMMVLIISLALIISVLAG